jgi:hypothetical protein
MADRRTGPSYAGLLLLRLHVNVAVGLCPLVGTWWLGMVATRSWYGVQRLLAAIVVGYAALATALALTGGLGSLLHAPLLRFPAGPLIATAILVAPAVVMHTRGWQAESRTLPTRWPQPQRWERVCLAVGMLLLCFAVVVYAVHPPTGFDATSYHLPMAVALFRGGTITAPTHFLATQWHAGRSVGNFPLAYPGAGEAVQGLLLRAFGEHAVWLPQFVFALAMAGAAGQLARMLGGRPWLPFASVLLCPLVVFQAGVAYTDIVAVGCLVIALTFVVGASVTMVDCAVAAIGVGAAVATKTVLLPVAVAVLLIVASRCPRRALLPLLALPVVLPGAVWWARDAAVFGNPLFPVAWSLGPLFHASGLPSSTFGLASQQRNFVPTGFAWPVYPVFEKFSDTSGFGALFAVVALPAVLLASLRRSIRVSWVWRGWLLVAAVSVVTAVAFPLPTPRFQLLPVVLTLAFCGLVGPLWGSRQRVVVPLAVAAVLVTAAVAVDRLRPAVTAPLDRSAFYAQLGYVESTAAGLGRARVWDDVSWSDFGFAAVYGLSGDDRQQEIFVGTLAGRTPTRACAVMPPDVDYVYVVADQAVPVTEVTKTYSAPLFHQVMTRTRKGPHGLQRRTLWSVSAACRTLQRQPS